HRPGNEPNDFVKRKLFRSDSIENAVFGLSGRSNRELSDILYKDRLESVSTPAGNREDGESPQQPGDVVDKDVLHSKDHCGADHCVRQARFPDGLLHQRLASEVRQARIFRGIRDAQVHDATHTGFLRGANQLLGIAHRLVESDPPVFKADPVGVEESVCIPEGPAQLIRSLEIKRSNFNLIAEWTSTT